MTPPETETGGYETQVRLTVNGRIEMVDAPGVTRLSDVLRQDLGLKGTKVGCDAGDCGACTVIVDDDILCACLTPVGAVQGASIESIESVTKSPLGRALAASFRLHGAAQCGFCTPGMMMAALALLRSNPTPTEDEIVDGLAGVLCRCTGYRKIISAVADVVIDPQQRDQPLRPAPGKAVGARLERVDGIAKTEGTDLFGADSIPADALTIQVVRSPHHAATFAFGDLDSYADRHRDVTVVVTSQDIRGRNAFGVIPGFEDQPVLAETATRYMGEAVAAVVGSGIDASVLDDFPIFWVPETETLLSVDGEVMVEGLVEKGQVDEALDRAEHRVSGSFSTSFVEHAYIEPEAGWAHFDDDILTIQATTQAPYMDLLATAAVLDLDPERLRIVPTACGGGFGGKLDISVQPLVALCTMITGKPTSLVYTRPESIAASTKRHPADMDVSLGADADGRLVAMDFNGLFNTGAYASWGPTVANRVPIHASGPYTIDHYRAATAATYTNSAPAGAFRGFGVPQAAIARECMIDELADTMGIDRLEFRARNVFAAGSHTATGQVLESGVGIGDCLDALAEPWQDALARAAEFNRAAEAGAGPGSLRRGVGLGVGWYGCGNTALPNPSTMLIGVSPDGRIMLHQGAVDIGQGSNTVMSQIAADALGMDVSDISLVGADTAITPDAGKTSASRQTYVSGNATYLAAQQLRAQILERVNIASETPSATAEFEASSAVEIELDDDGLRVTIGGEPRYLDLTGPLDEHGYVVSASGTYDPPTVPFDENGIGDPYAVYGYGAQIAEVDVDLDTGQTKVRAIVAAFDVGRAINPTLVEGQIEGGIAQGLGLALMEEFIPGKGTNLHDYLIPTIGDMPTVQTVLVESGDAHGPYGAKGVGEHALIPTAPAVLNAIRDATGVGIRNIPATPGVVHAALQRQLREQAR